MLQTVCGCKPLSSKVQKRGESAIQVAFSWLKSGFWAYIKDWHDRNEALFPVKHPGRAISDFFFGVDNSCASRLKFRV